jgi:predicted transposase/invertase (TIGR01784 family)
MQRSEAYWKKRQECIEEGRQKGRLESQKEITIAAFQKGFTIEVIIDLTGLSREEIEKLRESLG